MRNAEYREEEYEYSRRKRRGRRREGEEWGDGSDKTMKVPMGQGKDGECRGDYCTKMQIQSDGNVTMQRGRGREGIVSWMKGE